ncbi:neuropeptide FF receptor 2-like [Ylistrum balloti]|uniref:neuropeptide FF receptor 2-like n=1 Tax=Ylistrum balloti TaxID=509963 RepID=UPI002905C40F|nr:neuropeptide FF receptor 2-like [Ylistrum balloti]
MNNSTGMLPVDWTTDTPVVTPGLVTDNKSAYTSNSTERFFPVLQHAIPIIVVYTMAYLLVFLFAFFGNLIVVIVIWRNRWLHTVTNFFIVNLAVADILVAIFCVPITLLTNIYTGWPYGSMMCKVTPYLQGVSVCASVNTLAAIALDRYLAICYTLNYKLTGRVARVVMGCVWAFALCIMIPWAVFYQHDKYNSSIQAIYICHLVWPSQVSGKFFLAGIFLFCYTIPLLLIVVCYALIGFRVWNRNAPGIFKSNGIIHKSKVKAIKMLLVVVILFGLSWLPLYAINLKIVFSPPSLSDMHTVTILYDYLVPVSQWLGLANSGINPIIYCLFSRKIRTRIKVMVTCNETQEFKRQFRKFSSTRYVSVDYTNGQVTLRTHGTEKERRSRSLKSLNNVYD